MQCASTDNICERITYKKKQPVSYYNTLILILHLDLLHTLLESVLVRKKSREDTAPFSPCKSGKKFTLTAIFHLGILGTPPPRFMGRQHPEANILCGTKCSPGFAFTARCHLHQLMEPGISNLGKEEEARLVGTDKLTAITTGNEISAIHSKQTQQNTFLSATTSSQ